MNFPGKGLQKEHVRTQIYICSPNPFKTVVVVVVVGMSESPKHFSKHVVIYFIKSS